MVSTLELVQNCLTYHYFFLTIYYIFESKLQKEF